MEKHLFLIGMQGCGKSSLGKRTAKETGVPFADTDAIVAQSAGGLGDGEYELGGQPIFVEGISCRLADGTIAGSVLKMNAAVRNYRDHARVPLYEAVACASAHPAASVRLDGRKGSLLPGRDADILLLDENCDVLSVWKSGRRIR